MKSRSLLPLLALLGTGMLQGQAPAPDAFDALVKNSPFGQRAGEGAAAQSSALELRSVIVDDGEVLFSVFDPASRVSRWVGLNEAGSSFTVRSYDSAKNEVKVNYQGRELTLGLKQATIIALAAPPVPATGPGPMMSSPGPGSPSGPSAAVSNDQAVRLAQIAEEIARRRALRMQATKQPPTPGPPSSSVPVPQKTSP